MPASLRLPNSRRPFSSVRVILLTLGVLLLCPAAIAAPAPAMDFVLVTVAGLRADRLQTTVGGGPLMPVLSGLAARGMVMERAWTPVPESLPAAASIMTGVGPGRHGVRPLSTAPVALPTLARLLAAEGFETHAIVGGTGMEALRADFSRSEEVGDAAAMDLVARGLSAIAALPGGRRAFVWIHLPDPLPPLRPPLAGWLEMIALARNEAWDFRLPLAAESGLNGTLFTGAATGRLRRASLYLDAYDAVVRSVDQAIGRLFTTLERNTGRAAPLVMFASLHGLGLGDHEYWLTHGATLHEEELAVPIVWLGPGIRPGRQAETQASLLDLAPTALARLGLPQPSGRFEGVNLSPMLEGRGPAPDRPLFAAQLRAPWQRAALSTGRLKLILTPPPVGSGRDGRITRELYDLRSDPLEAFRIDGMRVTVANEMAQWLEDQFPALPGTPPAEDESRRR